MLEYFKKNYIDNNRYVFIIASILFGLCFVFEVPHGDDVTIATVDELNITSIITRVMKTTKGSFASSLTGIITVIFNNLPRCFFVIFMMIILFIALEGIRQLFTKGKDNEKYLNVFITFAVLTYSFIDMQSAGWIVTTCCYLVPASFMFFAILPIKKKINNESYKMWEYFLCTFSVILVGNQPQGMTLLLVCYCISFFFDLLNKKINIYCIFCFAISIVYAFLTVTSDWNTSRIIIETAKRMPFINMYNIINKIDIGLSSTFGWLFFGTNPFMIFTFLVLTFLIFVRYKNILLRIISIIPEVLCISFRKMYLSNMSINAFEIGPKDLGTSNYGLFNLLSIDKISTYVLFFVMCAIFLIFIIEAYLLTDNLYNFVCVIMLLIAGCGSRLALCLTPNIFASQQRTFIYFDFSIIASCIMIFVINSKYLSEKCLRNMSYILGFGSIIPLGYFFAYVYNYMGSSLFDLFK